MALRTSIIERTNEEILLESIGKKFRPAFATYDALPPGTHITILAITSNAKLTDPQMDQAETAIGNIAGIGVCKVLSQGPDNGVPALPVGYQVNLQVETSFAVQPTAE